MKKLFWRLQALYWFWHLAGLISWKATGELWDSFAPYNPAEFEDARTSVEDELEEWSR